MSDEPIKDPNEPISEPEPTPTPEPKPEPSLGDVMDGITGLGKRITDLESKEQAMTPAEMEEFFADEPDPTPKEKKGPIDYETASMGDVVQDVFDQVKSTYVDPLVTKVAQLTAKVEFNDLKDRFGDTFMDNRQAIARVGMANPHLSLEDAYYQVMGKAPATPTSPKTPPTPKTKPTEKPVPIGEKEGTAPGAVKAEPISDLDSAADEAYNEVMKGIK